ncbi:hypothetical protein [Variovorax saccharolyticus]|uniref:hypothetical protein n=1 Tax=Variovorax saccharolyticus TaxID=3053516 RepID=UPI0025788925|nr:hypothetical protein [Variovorax sp. J31P216]MDM0030379.1 hypothetical protein [Variovorax sp. J31P216]
MPVARPPLTPSFCALTSLALATLTAAVRAHAQSADSSGNNDRSLLADPKYRDADLDPLMPKSDELAESHGAATPAIGKRIALRLHPQL